MASRYKQVTQTVRTVFREPAPLKGMHYTDTPLDTGLGRVLINFEKNSDDTGIRPRKGAQLLNVYNCSKEETEHIKHLYFSDTLFKINPKTNKVHSVVRFVIANSLYHAWQGVGDATNVSTSTPISLEKLFKPDDPKLKHVKYLPSVVNNRLVSCVSFDSRNLIYASKLNVDATPHATKQHALFVAEANMENIQVTAEDVHKINPRQLNPTEAANWGFNMLSDNPYTFTSKDGLANHITFLGFLPYDSDKPDGNIVLNPICNTTTPYTFKLFTEVGAGTYAIRIRWRGVTNDVWESITPKSKPPKVEPPKEKVTTEKEPPKDTPVVEETGYDTTEDKAIAINLDQEAVKNYSISFNPKQEATIIQIKMYTKSNTKVLKDAYLDSKYTFIDGAKPADKPVENGIYSEDASIPDRDKAIFKHNDKYGNTYYYELKQNKWVYAAYPTSEDDAEEEIFAAGYRHLSTNAMSFNFVKSSDHSSLSTNNYDIGSAKGLCYWRNRAVAWGVDHALSTVFMSDINDPSYFPFPNNVCLFPEPVFYATPFQDDLLVFTKSQIWRVKLNPDGLTFTQTCIHKNLRIDEKDTPLTLALSSMVFFKSGPYFYLLVPSSKGTGDLVLAAISRTMEDVFKDPTAYIKKVLLSLYRTEIAKNDTTIRFTYPEELIMVGTSVDSYPAYYIHTYLDYDKIHIIYSSQVHVDSDTMSFSAIFNLVLSYDVNLRSWNTWVFESAQVPRLIEQDVIRQGIWASLSRYHIQYLVGTDTDLPLDISLNTMLNSIVNTDSTIKDKFTVYLKTYNPTNYTATPGTIITDHNVIINKELVNDMQTFSFTNENDRRDLLKRYDTQNNTAYKCGWFVCKGNDLQGFELYRTSLNIVEPTQVTLRFGAVILGTPTVMENYRYTPASDESSGTVTENFINYTAEAQEFYGVYIKEAPVPTQFYSIKQNDVVYNMFKSNNKGNLIVDPATRAIKNQKLGNINRKDIMITNLKGQKIMTHIWYYQQIEQGTIDSAQADLTDFATITDAFFFKNYQYLDTGNRNIVPEIKKKFREYQITINNKSNSKLDFQTEFVVDEQSIPILYDGFLEYTPVESLVKNENNVIIKREQGYGDEASVNYELAKAVEIPGTVLEQDDATRLNFMIDNTYYNKPFMVKLRVPTNAKGYLGRLKVLSKNQVDYELNDTTLVYRLQNAR